jgi:hypothetical protein
MTTTGFIGVKLAGPPIVCFKEGTMIDIMDNNSKQETQVKVEDIRKGMYVKTYQHGFLPVKHVAFKTIENPETNDRIEKRLYICDQAKYPTLKEPLIMTGCHSILIDESEYTDIQKKMIREQNGMLFKTDDKFRLPVMYDDKAAPYCVKGEYKVWHICLEHFDQEMNYGIYANGLLVESCSERNICLAEYDHV